MLGRNADPCLSEDFWIGGARGETPAFARAKARVDRHQFLPDVELLQLVEYREQMITSLSPREHQVLHEIGRGLTNREIGVRLGITEKTVKNTVTVVLAKLGLQRRVQAAVYIAVSEATGGRVTMLAG